jgi:hypothetical protein
MRRPILCAAVVFLCLAMNPTSTQAQAVGWNFVRLNWTATGDDSLTGNASQFDIRYSTSAITPANWNSATPVTGEPVPAAPGTQQTYTVSGLQPSTTYFFAIRTADEVPNWSALSNVVSRATLAVPDTIRPAAVNNLVASNFTGNSATLAWAATGDDSLTGTAASYDIRYSTSPITTANWSSATAVTGEPAPAAPGTAQNYVVAGLQQQRTYYFAIRVTDDAGNISALSNVPSGATLDVTPPAAVTDLVAGWIWLGSTGGRAAAPLVLARPPRAGVESR